MSPPLSTAELESPPILTNSTFNSTATGLETPPDTSRHNSIEKSKPLGLNVIIPSPTGKETQTVPNYASLHTLPSPTRWMPTSASPASPPMSLGSVARPRTHTISTFRTSTPERSLPTPPPQRTLNTRVSLSSLAQRSESVSPPPPFNLKSFEPPSNPAASTSQPQLHEPAPINMSRRTSISRIFTVGRSRKPKQSQPLTLFNGRKESDPSSLSSSVHQHIIPTISEIPHQVSSRPASPPSTGHRFPHFHKPTAYHNTGTTPPPSLSSPSLSKVSAPASTSVATPPYCASAAPVLHYSPSDTSTEWNDPLIEFFPSIYTDYSNTTTTSSASATATATATAVSLRPRWQATPTTQSWINEPFNL